MGLIWRYGELEEGELERRGCGGGGGHCGKGFADSTVEVLTGGGAREEGGESEERRHDKDQSGGVKRW